MRARFQADQLDCVPQVLTALDSLFIVEGPDELRDCIRARADRLAMAANAH